MRDSLPNYYLDVGMARIAYKPAHKFVEPIRRSFKNLEIMAAAEEQDARNAVDFVAMTRRRFNLLDFVMNVMLVHAIAADIDQHLQILRHKADLVHDSFLNNYGFLPSLR